MAFQVVGQTVYGGPPVDPRQQAYNIAQAQQWALRQVPVVRRDPATGKLVSQTASNAQWAQKALPPAHNFLSDIMGGIGGSSFRTNYGAGFGPQVTTGVQAGPIWGQQKIEESQQRMMAPGQPMGGALGELFSSLFGQMNQDNAVQFGRDAAYANAQHQLGSEQSRAQAGLGWGNIAAGDYASMLADKSRLLGTILSMLGGA